METSLSFPYLKIMMHLIYVVLLLIFASHDDCSAVAVNSNLKYSSKFYRAAISLNQLFQDKDHGFTRKFIPGSKAPPFAVPTLDNQKLVYPSSSLPVGSSLMFHFHSNHSGFLEAMWSSNLSLYDFINTFPAHHGVHCMFLNNDTNAIATANILKSKIILALSNAKWHKDKQKKFLEKMHFVTMPLSSLGGWLSEIFPNWSCDGAGCGLSQVWLQSSCLNVIKNNHIKRVDARFDWVFNHTWVPSVAQLALVNNDCDPMQYQKNKVNIIFNHKGNCSLVNKILFAQKAVVGGVLVMSNPGEPLQDLNCNGTECNTLINIPVANIHFNGDLITCLKSGKIVNASLHTEPSPNYYFGIDFLGNLVEPGWFLYPSLQFLAWQAQWLVYTDNLNNTIKKNADVVVPIFNNTIMHGKNGTGTVTVNLTNLTHYESVYLDMHLLCPNDFDSQCPPWDHTVSLYVCCQGSENCGSELGRWITPFRRRIGHWVTDITMISPLLSQYYFQDNSVCNFTMKVDAWWAQPWVTSLSLNFKTIIKPKKLGIMGPTTVHSLFQGGTFDKNYNKKYYPYNFTTVLNQTYEVYIYAVITGHGSDNNNCAEFCETTHHFIVNGVHKYIKRFKKAGTPKGCADQVLKGVVPNEHGTWLYGRDGWCDGQEIEPWVINISANIQPDSQNSIQYFAYYNGKDPNPTSNPGEIKMSSFLVYVGY